MTAIHEYIDHTLLKAEATKEQIEQLCKEASEHHFATVCVNPFYVPICVDLLKDTGVKVCTVVGFPLGANKLSIKRLEAEQAIEDGAEEIDYVLNISAVKNKDFLFVKEEMEALARLKEERPDVFVKCIFEVCYLTPAEIEELSILAKEVGLDFIKTSTGFGSGGATLEAVQLMVENSGEHVRVKASGGIRTRDQFQKYKELGVSRVGTSNGIAIISGTAGVQSY